jgi:hypothetical protein
MRNVTLLTIKLLVGFRLGGLAFGLIGPRPDEFDHCIPKALLFSNSRHSTRVAARMRM